MQGNDFIFSAVDSQIINEKVMTFDNSFGMIGGEDGMGETGTETGSKDPILSSVPFVAGTISAMLVVGIVLGVLLGKKRIKKGFDSYED